MVTRNCDFCPCLLRRHFQLSICLWARLNSHVKVSTAMLRFLKPCYSDFVCVTIMIGCLYCLWCILITISPLETNFATQTGKRKERLSNRCLIYIVNGRLLFYFNTHIIVINTQLNISYILLWWCEHTVNNKVNSLLNCCIISLVGKVVD